MNKLFVNSLPLICVLIQLISMSLFAFSFFDAQEVLFTTNSGANEDINRFDGLLNDNNCKSVDNYCRKRLLQSKTKPMFNKTVLVVIDALRHHFMPSIDHKSVHKSHTSHSSGVEHRMPFTERIMKSNGVGLVSVSATPTVTMPRIKAIISGTLPSFMDYIMNLNTYEFRGQNIIENAFKANKRVVFFGDETWIQLLSADLFHRSNGTSSFFATDYTEVDSNVTYNVRQELKRLEDWDIMIMHYLGVDHIGHSHGGYHSRLMPKKLLEMDSVIESVFSRVSAPDVSEPYLIVITGDHGMTDVGNHGGSTPEETDTALVFISTQSLRSDKQSEQKFAKRAERVLQVDIASTLSALLGLPMPDKSRGKVMSSVLNAMNMKSDEHLCHLFTNALQLTQLLTELLPKDKQLVEKAFKLHSTLITDEKSFRNSNIKSTTDAYNSYLSSIQTQLLTKMTENSIFSLLSLSLLLSVVSIVGFLLIEFRNKNSIVLVKVKDFKTLFALTTLALNCLLLMSTSFIEHQHYYWYYMTSTFALINLVITVRNYYQCSHLNPISLVDPFSGLQDNHLIKIVSILLVLVLARIGNHWNIHFHYDIGQWLNESENKRLLSALVICSLIAISFLMSTKRFDKQQCLLISGLVWVYLYRSDCGTVSAFKIPYFLYVERNIRAKIVFFHVYLIIIESFLKRLRKYFNPNIPFLDFLKEDHSSHETTTPVTSITLRTICSIWVLLSALFMKAHNIPLLAINVVIEKLVNYGFNGREDSYRLDLVVSYVCFAESAFYSGGNSNTLSTIDVSPAFIGLDTYQPIIGAVFMLINVYSLNETLLSADLLAINRM